MTQQRARPRARPRQTAHSGAGRSWRRIPQSTSCNCRSSVGASGHRAGGAGALGRGVVRVRAHCPCARARARAHAVSIAIRVASPAACHHRFRPPASLQSTYPTRQAGRPSTMVWARLGSARGACSPIQVRAHRRYDEPEQEGVTAARSLPPARPSDSVRRALDWVHLDDCSTDDY